MTRQPSATHARAFAHVAERLAVLPERLGQKASAEQTAAAYRAAPWGRKAGWRSTPRPRRHGAVRRGYGEMKSVALQRRGPQQRRRAHARTGDIGLSVIGESVPAGSPHRGISRPSQRGRRTAPSGATRPEDLVGFEDAGRGQAGATADASRSRSAATARAAAQADAARRAGMAASRWRVNDLFIEFAVAIGHRRRPVSPSAPRRAVDRVGGSAAAAVPTWWRLDGRRRRRCHEPNAGAAQPAQLAPLVAGSRCRGGAVPQHIAVQAS